MSLEQRLREEIASYREFLRLGIRGSEADQKRRRRISELIVRIKDNHFRAERITPEDEEVDVFG